MVEDERELPLLRGEALEDAVAQDGGEEAGEDDDVFAAQGFVVVDGLEQADKGVAAAEDEEVVVEVVAGEALQVAVAALGEDVVGCGYEEGDDEQQAGKDDDELQEIGQG